MESCRLFSNKTTYASGAILGFLLYFSYNPIGGVPYLYLAKLYLILWTLVRMIVPYIKAPKLPVVLSVVLGSIVALTIYVNNAPMLPLFVINILLGLSTIGYLYSLVKVNKTRTLYQLEATSINFIGVLLFILSQHPVASEFALLLVTLGLFTEIIGIFKEEKNAYENTFIRLDTLENKFQRAVHIEAKRRTLPLNDQINEIHRKTLKDTLTKVQNREGLSRILNQYIVDNNIKIVSIALFDIDFFKQINDNEGHIRGDETLKELVATLLQNMNKAFTLGRYGGDEFVIIMPNTNAPKAVEIMKDLCKKVELTGITISVGIASAPFDGKSQNELFAVADQGLYKSKELGRNQVQYTGNVPLIHHSL